MSDLGVLIDGHRIDLAIERTEVALQVERRSIDLKVGASRGGDGGKGDPGGNVMAVGLFTALSGLNVPVGTDSVQTTGWTRKGVGAGVYVDATGETLAAGGNGFWWTTTANGRKFKLDPDQMATPARMGAPLDMSGDDSPSIQRAHDYLVSQFGRGFIHLQGKRYTCKTKVTVDPTKVGCSGDGARLDWDQFVDVDPSSLSNLITNGTGSAGSTGWTQSTFAALPWTYGAGGIKLDPASTGTSYGNAGQRVAVAPGQKVEVTVVISRLDFVGTQRYVSFRLVNGTQPGAGAGPSETISGAISAPTTFKFTFTAPASMPNGLPWFTYQSNNLVSIDSIEFKIVPDNTCILIRAPAGAEQFGHAPFEWCNLRMEGRGYQYFADAFEFDTEAPTLSTRVTFSNVDIHWFRSPLLFGTRSYLCKFDNCDIRGNFYSVVSRTNSSDAGENISFKGCTLSATNTVIYNPGNFNLRFKDCSLDYSPKIFEGGGSVVIDGGWIEKNQNVTDLPWFDLYESATLSLIGKVFIQTTENPSLGPADNQFMFWGRGKYSRVILDAQGFNWNTVSGALMGGDGRLMSKGVAGGSNAQIPGIPKRDTLHDILGGLGKFETPDTPLMAWLSNPGGSAVRTASSTTSFVGTGVGSIGSVVTRADAAPGAWTVTLTGTGGTGTAFRVNRPDGTVDGVGVIGTRYQGTISFNTSAPTTNFVSGDKWTVTVRSDYLRNIAYFDATHVYATIAMSVSTDQAHSGTQSLKVVKTGIGIDAGVLYLIFPTKQHLKHTLEGWYKVMGVAGASTSYLYLNAAFVNVTGFDGNGVPIIDQAGRVDFSSVVASFPTSDGVDWTSTRLGSTYTDLTSSIQNDGFAPEWATHVLLAVNIGQLRENAALYLDDLAAYAL